jgi:fatty-acid desaturase
MRFLDRVLEPPRYGFLKSGKLYVPSHREIWAEFFSRLNVFESRKNWLTAWGWFTTCLLVIPFFAFFIFYFSWPLLFLGLAYSMVILGSHGTFWLHRYSTHRAFQFSYPWIRTVCRNLVPKVIPEEIYVLSHYVHHAKSEQPGDPYNVHGGWLYCFLADATHQPVNKNLSRQDYSQACQMLDHTGVHVCTYEQYQVWGSVCHPLTTVLQWTFNWAIWAGIFYWIGGMALVTAMFGIAGVWAFGVRTFNYDGHGRGKDRRQTGVDFNRKDWSVNQVWPGYVAGEWHNNHHLYQNGARSGFLPYQFDLPWVWISGLKRLGLVHSIKDYREAFYRDHYNPYLASRSLESQITSVEALPTPSKSS